MIILDTNVLSALMRASPDARVVAWLNEQIPEEIWICAVTVFETRFGLQRLAAGRKRDFLEAQFEALVTEDLGGRVAALDRAASQIAGMLAARRQAAGQNIDLGDTLIAGIAMSRRAAIATRNLKDFPGLDVPVIDPWTGTKI